MVTIRRAGPADAALIADMSRETFYDTFAADNTEANMEKFMSEQFNREKLEAEVSESGNIFFLAFDEEKPVGYARMREGGSLPELNQQPSIEIVRIYATRAAIGKGVGAALMQKCIDTAIAMKKELLWLGVWEKNERAIRFYRQWGFEQFGTHIFHLGDDPQTDWLMQKRL